MARLAQVAPLGRLAWWTLSLPSLLSLGRLGREVAYISDLSKQSPHVRCCEGFRMPAHDDGATHSEGRPATAHYRASGLVQ